MCAAADAPRRPAAVRTEQLDQQEDDFVDQGDAEISREIVYRLVMECQAIGREDMDVGKLRELCEQSGVPLGATSGILELILPPDDTSGSLRWKHFVVALCAQVGGVEDVTGFVRLLLDPGMFGNDEGQLAKTEFITLFDWWSSIDTSISAELKSALFAALDPKDDEVPLFCLVARATQNQMLAQARPWARTTASPASPLSPSSARVICLFCVPVCGRWQLRSQAVCACRDGARTRLVRVASPGACARAVADMVRGAVLSAGTHVLHRVYGCAQDGLGGVNQVNAGPPVRQHEHLLIFASTQHTDTDSTHHASTRPPPEPRPALLHSISCIINGLPFDSGARRASAAGPLVRALPTSLTSFASLSLPYDRSVGGGR